MRDKPLRVVFSPAAARDIEAIDTGTAIRIVKDIKTYLEVRPIPIGTSRIKKMAGFEPALFRMRSGDFRAYYRIRDEEVIILAVTQRKDSEKRLRGSPRIPDSDATPAFPAITLTSKTSRP